MNSYRPSYPMQCLFVDHFGPFNPADGRFKACLTVRDAFSGFLWLIPVPDLTGKVVAQNLETQIFTQFGPCKKLVSDNAWLLKAKLWFHYASVGEFSIPPSPLTMPQRTSASAHI